MMADACSEHTRAVLTKACEEGKKEEIALGAVIQSALIFGQVGKHIKQDSWKTSGGW